MTKLLGDLPPLLKVRTGRPKGPPKPKKPATPRKLITQALLKAERPPLVAAAVTPTGDMDRLEAALMTRLQAIQSAQVDLIDFIRFMNPLPEAHDDPTRSLYEVKEHHRAIAAALEKVAEGKIKRLIVTIMPRAGKTTLVSHNFPAWFLGKYPRKSIIATTYNDRFAEDIGRAIRSIMQAPAYAQVFPGTRLKVGAAAASRLEIIRGGNLFSVGRNSSMTGRGGDVLLVDDPIKDRKEADSRLIRDRVWEWFNQVVRTRLMTDTGCIVIVVTRWHFDDIVGRLTDPTNDYYNAEEAAQWKQIDLPAIAREHDPLGRKPGEVLWPERFNLTHLESIRASDPRGFNALYQGRPAPDDGAFFKLEWLHGYKTADAQPPKERMRFFIASDHAVSLEQSRDKTCIIVAGQDITTGRLWIQPDIFWQQANTETVVEVMLNFMAKYQPIFWWAEKGHISKSIGPFLRRRMMERRIFSSIVEVTPVADKQSRAQAINARLAMGYVSFPHFARWWSEAQDQILKFPAGAHDDFVDALSLIGIGLALQMRAKREERKAARLVQTGSIEWVKEAGKLADTERKKQTGGGW